MLDSPSDQLFRTALGHHQAGRLREAEQIYRQILAQNPRHADALHLLGLIAYQVQRHDVAADLISRAVALQPNNAVFHCNLGNAFQSQGMLEKAIACHQRALALQPDYALACNNLGNALREMQRPDEAIASYRRAITLKPDFAEAHGNLGVALRDTQRPEEAVASHQRALAIKPGYAEAHNNLGNALRDMQRLEEAITSYARAVALRPNYAEAHYNLGNALRDARRLEEAIASYQRALALRPENAIFHRHLGRALHQQGASDKAIACYQRAVALRPGDAETHNDLGLILHDVHRLEEAIASFQHAVKLAPDFAQAHGNLGNALRDAKRPEEAIASYRRALALQPDDAQAHSNLGVALREAQRLDEAIASLQRAVELKPDLAAAHENLGNALLKAHRLGEAIASYQRALALQPDHAQGWNNLGNALLEAKQLDEAIASYQRALALQPDYAEAHSNLGNALHDALRLEEAIASCRRAVALKPDLKQAHFNLGNALRDTQRLEEAIASFQHALTLPPDLAEAHSNLLFAHQYHCGSSAEEILRESLRWEELYARPLAAHIAPLDNERDPERPLRIGYVSPDLHRHSVAFFLLPLLEAHDRRNFHITCYATSDISDAVTERLRACSDDWCSLVDRSDEQAAERIRNDRIDILIDLCGHTGRSRLLLFARKPAPVQVTGLGFPGTTGLRTIDYRFTDALADPPGEADRCHTEALVRLPDTAWCFAPLSGTPPVAELPAKTKGFITFGCFNNLTKVTPFTLDMWARLLGQVPASRLLLKGKAFRRAEHVARFQRLFSDRGIASERLELVPTEPEQLDHLRKYDQVDIALDTFPYHGTTTTCEALWMGVPVVTLAGDRHASRVGVSLLTNVGLPELIGRTEDEYVRIAASLAADLARLSELRGTLRARMQASPLMNAPRFARNVEAAYRQMWRKYCTAQ